MVDPLLPTGANDDQDDERLLIALASLKVALRAVTHAKVPLAACFVNLAIHYCRQEQRNSAS